MCCKKLQELINLVDYQYQLLWIMRRGKSRKEPRTSQDLKEEDSMESDDNYDEPRDYFSLKMKAHKQGKNKQNKERDEDPVSLLQHYTTENYRLFMNKIKDYAQYQKPFSCSYPELEKFIHLGANICIYGYGSKKKFLISLKDQFFHDYYVWEVKGYLLTIHTKKIYNYFGEFLKRAGVASEINSITIKDQLAQYKTHLKSYIRKNPQPKPLLILFHCLDGQQILDVDSQNNLSELFSLPGIRILASIDNIKISTMWHPRVKEAFKFLFFKINTRVNNIEEQIYKPVATEKTYQVQQSLMNICQSLNDNQKKILKILAKNELDNLSREHSQNYTVSELLDVCIEQVILSSDSQLRQNLLELLDHKVLTQKMDDVKNRKVLILKYEKKLLDKIMALKSD